MLRTPSTAGPRLWSCVSKPESNLGEAYSNAIAVLLSSPSNLRAPPTSQPHQSDPGATEQAASNSGATRGRPQSIDRKSKEQPESIHRATSDPPLQRQSNRRSTTAQSRTEQPEGKFRAIQLQPESNQGATCNAQLELSPFGTEQTQLLGMHLNFKTRSVQLSCLALEKTPKETQSHTPADIPEGSAENEEHEKMWENEAHPWICKGGR